MPVAPLTLLFNCVAMHMRPNEHPTPLDYVAALPPPARWRCPVLWYALQSYNDYFK